MRIADVSDYFKLRQIATNPFETLRFRRRLALGDLAEVKLRSGQRLQLRAGRADYHMFHRIFVRDEYRLLPLVSKPIGDVVDLGGNVGIFAARMAPLAERVFSYEPVPENFAQLTENVGACQNVTAVQKAVSGEAGELTIHCPVNQKQSGVYSARPHGPHASYEGAITVEALALDGVFQTHAIDRCDLLKIDVEGSEYDILHSLSDEGWARIQRIHGEYHDVGEDDPRTRLENFQPFLEDKGFKVDVEAHRRKPNHGMFFATRV